MQKKIYTAVLLLICFLSFSALSSTYNSKAAIANARLGLAYLSEGMYSQSKATLLQAINEDPRIASVWFSMAYYFEKTGHNRLAEQYYKRAISIDPHSGSARNNYGNFLCRTGREPAGIRQLIKATNEKDYLDPAGAYQNAGICALMMHNHTLALHYFHKAIDNNPSMPFSLLSVARLDHQMGNEVSAQKNFIDFQRLVLAGKPANIVKQYHDYVFDAVVQK